MNHVATNDYTASTTPNGDAPPAEPNPISVPIHNDSLPTADMPAQLEQLRDILFGAQSRTFEQRFRTLELRVAELYQELGARLEAQDSTQRADLAARSAEIQTAMAEAAEASHQRDEALRVALDALDNRLEGSKVARHELGALLVAMGQQIQQVAT